MTGQEKEFRPAVFPSHFCIRSRAAAGWPGPCPLTLALYGLWGAPFPPLPLGSLSILCLLFNPPTAPVSSLLSVPSLTPPLPLLFLSRNLAGRVHQTVSKLQRTNCLNTGRQTSSVLCKYLGIFSPSELSSKMSNFPGCI